MLRKLCSAAAAVVLISVTAWPQAPMRSNDPDRLRSEIVDAARSYIGTPYVLGGSGSWGMDCSGLIYNVYGTVAGRPVPRTVARLSRYVESISRDDLLPGDLVFFNTTGPFSHAGIYVGDGRVIHAASEYNRNGVVISRLDRSYYQERFNRAGRLAGEAGLEKMDELWAAAVSYLGTPYVAGGESRAGADCSGFVCAIYDEVFGIELPRTVVDMAQTVADRSAEVSRDELLPGDLLFFDTTGPLSHVGVYLGNDKVVHAASDVIKNGVILSELSAPYYDQRFAGAGRVLPVDPIPWFILRSATSLRISESEGFSVSSGISAYYNSLGRVDLGAEARIVYSPATDTVGVPVSVNVLLNRRMWFRVGYRHGQESVNPIVPDFLSVGLDLSRLSDSAVRFSSALEIEYAIASRPIGQTGFQAALSGLTVSVGASLTGVF